MGTSNSEFSRQYSVVEAFEARAARIRMTKLEAITLSAFVHYKVMEPFRSEVIQRLREVRAKYPPPPPESRNELPRIFGFVAKPVIEYLAMARETARLPHAWRIAVDGDRLNPDHLAYILNPGSPRYYDSADNRVENFVTAPGALRLINDIRAHNWQPEAALA